MEWPCSPGSSTEVGESPQACADRGRAGIEALLKVGAEDDAVDETLPMAVVAHGAFNKLLISSLLWNDVRRSSELEQVGGRGGRTPPMSIRLSPPLSPLLPE